MVQWLRIHLTMQGTAIQALVWEDPMATGQLCPRTAVLRPRSPAAGEATAVRSPWATRREQPAHGEERSNFLKEPEIENKQYGKLKPNHINNYIRYKRPKPMLSDIITLASWGSLIKILIKSTTYFFSHTINILSA